MDIYYEAPAASIVAAFTSERVTVDDSFWIAQWAHAHAFPSTVVDKINAFCYHFLTHSERLENANAYTQDTLF